MASITERNDGSYRIRVSCGRDIDGKQIFKSKTFHPTSTTPAKIRKEVQKAADLFEDEVKNGKFTDAHRMTFKEYCGVWYTDYATQRLARRTVEETMKSLERFAYPTIGHIHLSDVRPAHIQTIVRNMEKDGYKSSSIRRAIAMISGVFTNAVKKELIDINPASATRLDLPSSDDKKEIVTFTPEEAERFLQALEHPFVFKISGHIRIDDTGIPYQVHDFEERHYLSTMWKTFFTLALLSGCRRGELLALKWSDIDFDNSTLTVERSFSKVKGGQILKAPKTRSGFRTITVASICITALRKWKLEQMEHSINVGSVWEGTRTPQYDDNFIFTQDNGKAINLDSVSHKLHEVIQNYNSRVDDEKKIPDINFHSLRHCNATLLIAGGTDIRTVSGRLGHAKTSTTLNIYSHYLESKDKEASDTLENVLSLKAVNH